MNHDSLSSIETITTDSEEFVSVSSHVVAAIPSNHNDGQVNESAPVDGFFKSIMFIGIEHCDAIREAFHGSFRLKIKGFLMCILLPFSIILTPFRRTCSQKRKVTQIAIVYIYVFMTCSIVLNLWVQLEPHNNAKEKESSYHALQYFEAAMMGLTLIPIICIAFETYGRVEWKTYDKVLVFYFQLGLYVFGISSSVYSFLKMCNAWSCGNNLFVLVYACKFVFILSQIMFLSYFYQAKLPSRDWKLQLSLAHIMVTNLSLWIWVVCKEVYDPFDDTKPMDCQAIHLSHTEKYFYPLFIEYLLIVAGMVYELWSDMKMPYQTQRGAIRLHHTEENHDRESESNSNLSLRTILPRDIRRALYLAATFVSAAILCCTFISRLLASADSAHHDKKWYLYFIYANIVFYISQIAACYVIKVCSQSQPFNRYEHSDVPHAVSDSFQMSSNFSSRNHIRFNIQACTKNKGKLITRCSTNLLDQF